MVRKGFSDMKSARIELRKKDDTVIVTSLMESVKYLVSCVEFLRIGDYKNAIDLLNSNEKRPVILASELLGREVTDEEKPFFYNQCSHFAPTKEIRMVSSTCKTYQDTHKLLRAKMRELSAYDVIPAYETKFVAGMVELLADIITETIKELSK